MNVQEKSCGAGNIYRRRNRKLPSIMVFENKNVDTWPRLLTLRNKDTLDMCKDMRGVLYMSLSFKSYILSLNYFF